MHPHQEECCRLQDLCSTLGPHKAGPSARPCRCSWTWKCALEQVPHLASCDVAVCIGFHKHQRVARPASRRTHDTHSMWMSTAQDVLTATLSSTSEKLAETFAMACKHVHCLLQVGQGQDNVLTCRSSCASNAQWGFLCQNRTDLTIGCTKSATQPTSFGRE